MEEKKNMTRYTEQCILKHTHIPTISTTSKTETDQSSLQTPATIAGLLLQKTTAPEKN